MHRIRTKLVLVLSIIALVLIVWRAGLAVRELLEGDETGFLAFPLAVVLPTLAFCFLATRRGMESAEGALMQLGAMIHLLLIIALPDFSLYLALGFPVVFLVVELFETKLPRSLRDPVKRSVLA